MYKAYNFDMAAKAIPILIDVAKRRGTITYGELSKRIGLAHHRPLRFVLGYILHEICVPKGLPLLTSIVVKKGSRLPGESFVPEGASSLQATQFQTRAQHEQNRVYGYKDWDSVLRSIGLKEATNDA